MTPTRVEISYKTIVFTVAFLGLLYLLWEIRSILTLIFVCFIFMEALNPTISRLERLRLPRPAAILLIYLLLLLVVSTAVVSIVPVLVEQTSGLIETLPAFIANTNLFGLNLSTVDWNSQFRLLENLPSSIARFAVGIVSNIFSAFILLVITFYLLMERRNLSRYSFRAFGGKGKRIAISILDRLELRLSSWLNAQLILMTLIGLLSYLAYTLIGLSFTVPLALMAGLLEAVPNIGPTVATILAALVGFTISPLHALLAVIVGITIQQLENNIIVPRLMNTVVGINPLLTIIVIATGAKLGGVGGAILAIPVYLTLEIIYSVIQENRQRPR